MAAGLVDMGFLRLLQVKAEGWLMWVAGPSSLAIDRYDL
jgi:hypothetical protein